MAAAEPALLVVDDNDDNRYTLVHRLKRQGYTNLATAANGREALELLRARPFDLVLLDVTMPEMNGYEVLEHLKADARLRHVPVVMISALDQVASVVRCIELGAEDYLPKPFDPTLLKARVGASLEKKRLRDELEAHLARIEADLESARRIQLSMVPGRFPAPTAELPLDLFATLHPARQIGGDLYDFFFTGPQSLCVAIADVSDKGAAAALFMARTKTLIRALAGLMNQRGEACPEPDVLVARVNEELCRDNPHCMFATLLLVTIDFARRELRCCNAGHLPPYVMERGELGTLAMPRGKPLGIRPDFAYSSSVHPLDALESVFLYTDGVTEAFNEAGELFSEVRLENALRGVGRADARGTVTAVVDEVRRFAGECPQSDDIAALAVRFVDRSTVPPPADGGSAPGSVP